MAAELDILEIVKEDILRILGEGKKEEISIESIKSEINASDLFISKAVEELERGLIIIHHDSFISLTKKGEENAKDVLKKHLVIEDYFREKNKKDAHKIAHVLEHYVSKEVIDNIKKLSTFKGEGVPLREFEIDKEGVITDITFPDYGVFERIISMGILPGEKVRITSKIPNGVVVEIKNKKIAIDKNLARKIRVIDEKT